MKASKNAFKGYSYQKSIYTYFLLKMDLERKISSVEAEITPEGHNFDDVLVCENDILYYIQTKNYENIKKIEINNKGIKSNGDFSTKSEKGVNVFILNNAPKDILEINSNIFGLEAYFEDDIYVIPANVDELFEGLFNEYNNNSRFSQMLVFSEKMASDSINYVCIEDLPEYKFFSMQLMEETINIRKFTINDEKGIKFIIGKPGVGKSHLVNEIKDTNSLLYRFWISDQDENKLERLQYKNFIQELSIKVFDNFIKYSEEDIIKKISDDKKVLIIDGLDHVENYNPSEIDNFFEFFYKLEKNNNVKVLILSRPLKKEIKWEYQILENWTKDETYEYINYKYQIKDYETIEKIFNITDGYPIITDFIVQHYIYNNEIIETNKITDINEYYDKIIGNEEIKNELSIFITTSSYITYYEIDKIFGHTCSQLVKSFINKHKYLFEIRLNRITLIHDSFNTYLIQNQKNLKSIKKQVNQFILDSINKDELRFLARIDKFDISNEDKKQILVKYCNFKMFDKLCSKNIDIEGIFDFYLKLKDILINNSYDVLNIYQYYEFILILTIVKRDHLSFSNALIYEQLRYYKKNNINIQDNIYSSRNLFYIYYTIITGNSNLYKKVMYDHNYDGERNINEFYEEINDEIHFFDINKEFDNIDKYEQDYLLNNKIPTYQRMKRFSKFLSYIFINKLEYKEYYAIINNYILKNDKISVFKLESIFRKIGLDGASGCLRDAREEIYSKGECRELNPYINLSLKALIDNNRLEGSFSLNEQITAYIRLAIKEKRKIDIYNINQYYCMYYNRKDYTVYTLPTILKILYDKKIIPIESAIEIIDNSQQMSEKGIRHILCEFINMLDKNTIQYIDNKLDLFCIGNKYHFYLHGLNPDIINFLSKDYVIYEIESELGRHIRSKSIDFSDIENYLKSEYKDFVIKFIIKWEIKIYNVPKSYCFKDSNVNIEYRDNKNEIDYIIGEAFEKGFLVEEDSEYIKSKHITHIELSKYLDGWYSKFAIISLYNIYDKNILKRDLLQIIHTTLKYGKENIKYDGDYNHYLGNIPQFLFNIEYNVDWQKINEIVNKFLKISKIII